MGVKHAKTTGTGRGLSSLFPHTDKLNQGKESRSKTGSLFISYGYGPGFLSCLLDGFISASSVGEAKV